MDLYKILLIVLIVFLVYFTYYHVTGKSAYTLTSTTKTDSPYIVTASTINQINQNMTVSNYAISIWIYIDKWELTATLKNIINIPNILDLKLSSINNNLGVVVGYNGTSDYNTPIDINQIIDGGYPILPPYPILPIPDPDNVPDNVPDNPIKCPGMSYIINNINVCDDVFIGTDADGLSYLYDMSLVSINTVYQDVNQNNVYTFVYAINPDTKLNWNQVQVYFLRPALMSPQPSSTQTPPPIPPQIPPSNSISSTNYGAGITASTQITDSLINNGYTPLDGFQLESHGSKAIGKDLLLNLGSSPNGIHWQTYTQPNTDYYPTNPPTITYISAQYNNKLNKRSITIKLIDAVTGLPYFNPYKTPDANIPYFTFIYYSDSSIHTIGSPVKLITSVFPPNEPFSNNSSINMLYTPSSLFNIYNDNIITNTYKHKEGLELKQATSLFAGVVNNIALQTWVNITVNINNRSLDIYINGKLEQTYIIPGVPNQMDGTPILVSQSPSFNGWTAQLQYYPYNLNPQSIWNIYQQGYSNQNSIWSLLSKYSLKLIFVDNSTKNQVVV